MKRKLINEYQSIRNTFCGNRSPSSSFFVSRVIGWERLPGLEYILSRLLSCRTHTRLAKTRACNTAFPVTCLTSFLKNNDKTLSRSEIHGLTSKTMRPTENNPDGADQQTVTETHGHHCPRLRSPGAVCILRSSARVWLCLVSNSVSLEQHRMHYSMPGSFQLIFCI